MSDYKKLENELYIANQSKFQDVIFHIIDKKYDNPTNIVYLGGAVCVDGTRWGTPDVFFQLPDGEFIFVEVTTQKQDLLNKAKGDIEKCKKEAKKLEETGFGVKKVIFACCGKFTVDDISECQKLCREFCSDKVAFEFWGIDKLCTMLLNDYMQVAITELCVKFSYGTIKTLDEYLLNNSFDVSQTHEFLYRENELEEIKKGLSLNNIVLVYGSSGCGKTRLCMHIAKELKNASSINEIYFIKNAFSHSIDDLLRIAGTNRIAIILDDVNRLPLLKDFIAYAQEYKNILILATVRDYAFNNILTDLKVSGYDRVTHCVKIEPLNTEQQEEIIKKMLPGATYDLLKTIRCVSRGNLRFAVMMVDTIKSGKAIPTQMKELMSNYFARVESDLKQIKGELSGKDSCKFNISLTLISLLHRVVIVEGEQAWVNFINALEALDIDYSEFVEAMIYWDQRELVGISFSGKVFEISDQILSCYLFYRIVFEEKIVDLKILFNALFPMYRSRFVDMFNSLLAAYGTCDGQIQQQILELWNTVYKQRNDSETVQFVETFHALLQLETLEYINNIDGPISERFIDILCDFEQSEHYAIAIEILLDDLSSQEKKEQIIKKIVEGYSIRKNSFQNNLEAQRLILDKIKQMFNKGDCYEYLFCEFAKKLLNLSFQSSEMSGNSMVIFTINAYPCTCLYAMRKSIWLGIIELYMQNYNIKELRTILKSFNRLPSGKDISDIKDIFIQDSKIILPFIDTLSESLLSFEQKTVIKLLMECCCSEDDIEFQKRIQKLSENDSAFKIYSYIYKRKNEYKYDPYFMENKYFEVLDVAKLPEDFYTYIDGLQIIDTENRLISEAINYYFIYLNKQYPEKYISRLKEFLNKYKDISITLKTISRLAIGKCCVKELIDYLQKSCFKEKDLFVLELLSNLKVDEITNELYELCLSLIIREYSKEDKDSQANFWLTNFLEYEQYKSGFIVRIYEFINSSTNNNLNKYRLIDDLYYTDRNLKWKDKELTIEKVEEFFGNKVQELYYEMFFVLLEKNILHISGDFLQYLASKNISYLYRYYDYYFDYNTEFRFSDYLDIHVVGKLPNLTENMLNIWENAIKKSQYFCPSYSMSKIFSNNFTDETFYEFISVFVKNYIFDQRNLGYMATLLSSMKKEWQYKFVSLLIENKLDIEIFKKLSIFGYPTSWSGGDTIMYEKRLNAISEFIETTLVTKFNLPYIIYLKEMQVYIEKCKDKARLRDLAERDFFS